jgi:hypothetical protein
MDTTYFKEYEVSAALVRIPVVIYELRLSGTLPLLSSFRGILHNEYVSVIYTEMKEGGKK